MTVSHFWQCQRLQIWGQSKSQSEVDDGIDHQLGGGGGGGILLKLCDG